MNYQAMAKRHEELKWATKLQEILGDNYKVSHDTRESGMTNIYFKNVLVKRVPNEEMKGSLNVCDYTVNDNWKREHGFSIYE